MNTAFFLSSGPPFPDVGARRIRDQQIIHLLAQRFDHVEAVCMGNPADLAPYREEALREFGPKVNLSIYSSKSQTLVSRGLDIVRPHFAQGFHASIAAFLRSNAKPGDLLWTSRLRMAKYMKIARELGCNTVLDEHQIESDLLFDNAFAKMKYWYQGIEAIRCALYERRLCEVSHIVVAGAEIDLPRMEKLNPEVKVKVLPYSVDPRDYQLPERTESEQSKVILFGDLDYEPNVNAIEWLVKEIFPRLKAALGDEFPRFQVTTAFIPNGIVRAYPEIDFHQTTSRQDLLLQFASARLVIFPLRYGRGNRIHLLEAMAAGMPIVTTGRDADGVPVVPSRDAIFAEEVDGFTSSIMRLIRDRRARDELGRNARRAAESIYSIHNDLERFDEILATLPQP